MNFKEKLCQIENGRFKKIIECISVVDRCEDCFTFNNDCEDSYDHTYKCKRIPSCIGITLSENMKGYLIQELYK